MKILEKEFTTKNHVGFEYFQVLREGKFAIYEQHKDGKFASNYEAIRIHSHNGFEKDGKIFPAAEYYPKSSAWGVDGFTLKSKSLAMDRIARMQREDKNIEKFAKDDENSIVIAKKIPEANIIKKDTVKIKFPETPHFTVKELAELNSVPLNLAYLEVRNNPHIKKAGKQKKQGRGKPSQVYMLV